MKVSLNLIKQLTRVKLGNDELLSRINSRLAEVENLENLPDKYQGILVAEIKEAKEHPDADKLGIYQIYNGKKTIQVVAGDKTLKVGDKVAHIAPGLTVPATFDDAEPFVMKKIQLRGKDSNGMLGSAKELAFGDDHDKVLVLDTSVPAGTTLIEAYDLDDQIIDIENKTLTNRPDCFGLIGFAREVAGIQDLQFTSPSWFLETTKIPKSNNSLKLNVKNEVPKDCPTYLATAVSKVEIKQSPVHLMTYLSRLGVRPINNIVDMTNYYMIMTGQPLHAFDYDKLASGNITVRYPKKGEKLTLLDGKEIEIHAHAVTICDDKGPIALGGVMGGANSEISNDTKNIVIECANFDMYSIRTTSMKHGIFSDAATRYMRGQSPVLCEKVLAEVLNHPEDYGGGKVASEIVGSRQKAKDIEIAVKFEKVNELLGADMASDEQKRRLKNVEIITNGNKVKVPFWRRDLNIWQDIAEEVGRLSGYDNLKATLPSRSIRATDLSDLEIAKQEVRELLSSAGGNELLTYSGVSTKLMEKVNLSASSLYRIRNSLSPELELMRASLLPSLMDKVHLNHKRGYGLVALFEIGKTHSKKSIGKDRLPVEYERLGFIFSADDKTASTQYGGDAFYQVKTYLEYLLKANATGKYSFVEKISVKNPYSLDLFTPKRRAIVMFGTEVLGVIGEFTHRARSGLKLPEFSAGFEIDLEVLSSLKGSGQLYAPLPRFPGTEHDVTFETPVNVTFEQVLSDFEKNIAGPDLVTSVKPVDIYQKSRDSKTRNITLRLKISSAEKTMSSEEINMIVDKAVSTSEKKLALKRI